MAIAGGCRCGAARYVLAIDAVPPVYCCHCRDCQTWSGSAFTEQGVTRVDALTATGPIVEYARTGPSGAVSVQSICSICHTRLWNTNTARPGMALLRAGTLEESDALAPRAHIWVSRKQPWLVLPDDVPAFAENAPPAEFLAILLRP